MHHHLHGEQGRQAAGVEQVGVGVPGGSGARLQEAQQLLLQVVGVGRVRCGHGLLLVGVIGCGARLGHGAQP